MNILSLRFITVLCCLMLVSGFVYAVQFKLNPAYAQEKHINQADLPRKILKSPLIQIGEYNGSGRIDAVINKENIIINDSGFILSPFLRKFDLKGRQVYNKLEKGLYVYYFLDEQGRVLTIYIVP